MQSYKVGIIGAGGIGLAYAAWTANRGNGVTIWNGRSADSTTLGHPARAHLDTRSTRTWTPDPRPLGQAVGAQRRRVALLV